jgi:serine/threonine-protein kinase RsbW
MKSMKFSSALCLPRDALSVPFARRVVRFTMAQLGVDPGCIQDMEVALTEACTNVLRHAHGEGDEYEIEIAIDDLEVSLSVKDTGHGFDHASLAEAHEQSPDLHLDITEEGGRGIMLMRALVDNVEFASAPEAGTIVHMTKAITYPEDSMLARLETASHASG